LIQHILTEDIFSKVFGEDDFHRQNNVAKKLYDLEDQFFTGGVKKKTLKALEPYYAAIRAAAAQISSHHEKQAFLKVIYENFYKVYNPKAADRLGVIYTPNEIVRFMVESADWLCQHHFGKRLIDKNVEILDPASGTGTFITELLEHFRGQAAKLKYKYREELHANEVAILPYYVANLNIEATYAALTGEYEEFPNLCFVDTLDNVGGLRKYTGHMDKLFGSVSEENVARIRRQNKRKISVIIGNPPYNANQLNENENNKNREYPDIDKRIKQTYIAVSTAQKTKLYDMYARFFRWASDRLDENGIIAFVSNSSFIDSRTFDGFRKVVEQEFNEIWVIDLKGNARTSGERRRQEGGNVFYNQIRVGIAVYFCVKKKGIKGCKIYYQAVRDYVKADEKRDFLNQRLNERKFEQVIPDKDNNWINISDNDFNTLIPIASKKTNNVIFRKSAIGVSTNRDDWVFDFSIKNLQSKIHFLIKIYNEEIARLPIEVRWLKNLAEYQLNNTIKWSEALKRNLVNRTKIAKDKHKIKNLLYRPYVSMFYYSDPILSDRLTRNHFGQFGRQLNKNNVIIAFSGTDSKNPFHVLASKKLIDLHSLENTQTLSMFQFSTDGNEQYNITDWALLQFTNHYENLKDKPKQAITKDAIFHYVYGVLHDPVYREKYSINLKRKFPRLPFYADFWQWATWGEKLMNLHIGYETVEPWPLQRLDVLDTKSRKAGLPPKAKLKADKDAGLIVLDSETQLNGIPKAAWDYKLGNLSALEWILEQYKEKTPKDPTIREKFNTYRFADYKEHVIDLLLRITRVSVETQEIVEAMRTAKK